MITISQPDWTGIGDPDTLGPDTEPTDAEIMRHLLDEAERRQAEEADQAKQAEFDDYARRQQAARDNIRREREEADLAGTLTGNAQAFHDLQLKPKIAAAGTYEPQRRVPLVQGLFNRNTLSWVAGPSGTFKSFVTADLAFRYGSGDMDYHGRKMTHGRALIIVAEGEDGYAHRRVAWEKQHDRKVDNVYFYPGALQLGNIDRDMPALLHHLREEDAAGRPYGLIVVDTQAMCTVGVDENSSEMNLVINVLHRIRQVSGACVMPVHHFGKSKSAGMRGSSMLYAAADTILVLKREDDSMDVTLSTAQQDEGKQKDLPTEKDLLRLSMRFHVTGKDYFDDDVTSLAADTADAAGHDVTDTADTPPAELPSVTERQMLHLRALNFYEGSTTSPSGLTDLMNEEAGHKLVARNGVRNVLMALKKLGLADETGKAQWRITPLGVAVIAREVSDRVRRGEQWTERAGRPWRGKGPSEGAEELGFEGAREGENKIE